MKNTTNNSYLTRAVLLSFLILTLLPGCTIQKAIVEPPQQRGFIEYKHNEGEVTNQFPFAYTWIEPGIDSNAYSKIIFAPIDVSLIPDDDWLKSLDITIRTKSDYQEKTKQIAQYFQNAVSEIFSEEKESRYTLVEAPDNTSTGGKAVMTRAPEKGTPGTVQVEIALTEIIFGKPLVYAGTFAIPLPATSYMFDSVSSPMLSMEGRVRDAVSGKIIAVFADRKLPQVKPFDLNKFTTSSALHEVIDRWADELFRSFNREGNSIVKKTSTFSLIPW